MTKLARFATLAAVALLAACGGGGSSSVPSTTAANGSGTATPFSVIVAAASSVTKIGIASSAESGSPEHDINVAAGSSSCTANGSTRTCTASFSLPAGPQTLTVSAYGTKTVRSTVRTTLTGARVALAVGTAIAQISLDLAVPQLAGGTAGTTSLYVTARDANGNTIVGDFGGATIAITSSDTTNSVTLTPASVTAGGTVVAVSYNGSGSVSSVTFNATSSGVATSAIVPATLTFTSSQLMYTASGNTILVFAGNATGDTPPIQRITVSGYTYATGAEPDGHGNIWTIVTPPSAVTNGNATIYGGIPASVPATANGPVTPTLLTTLPAQTVSAGLALDGSGNLYVLQQDLTNTYKIYVFAPGQTTASRTIAPSVLAAVTQCSGLDVAADGTIAVRCEDQSTAQDLYVFAAGANGAVSPARTISGAATTFHSNTVPGYVVWAHDGSLVTADYDASDNTAILVFAPGANGNVAPTRRIAGAGTGLDTISIQAPGGGSGSSYGIGVDSTDTIYVGQYGSQSIATGQILIFGPTATGAVAPSAVLGGPLTGLGTAYAPIYFASGVVPALTSTTTPSVTGDFLSPVANRGWNYTLTAAAPLGAATPAPGTTVSVYANPTPVNGDTELVTYEVPGVQTTALNAPGAVFAGEALFVQGTGGGWAATAYVPVSDGADLGGFTLIPGNIGLLRGTLALGQSFDVYLGLTANVVSVGAVPGSAACPGGAATGAIVAYTYGQNTETVGYVPGCGITYFVSDNGSTAILTSVGTYSNVATSVRRGTASVEDLHALRTLWSGIFTPWRP